MWPLVKTFVTGNPYTMIAIVVGVIAWSATCTGFGYYKAVGQYEAAQLSNQAALVSAQHDKDIAEHNRANAENKLAKFRHDAGNKAIVGIQAQLDALPEVSCDPTSDVIKLLNEAGK